MTTELIVYVGGLLTLGSILGFFVLVDYFQLKQNEKAKETRINAIANDLVISDKTTHKK